MNDQHVPFQMVHGIIAIDEGMGDMDSYTKTLLAFLGIVPYGEAYVGMKIRVSRDEMSLRFISADGKMTTARMKTIKDDVYEWIE
jgi:hypothetical protein